MVRTSRLPLVYAYLVVEYGEGVGLDLLAELQDINSHQVRDDVCGTGLFLTHRSLARRFL